MISMLEGVGIAELASSESFSYQIANDCSPIGQQQVCQCDSLQV